MIDQLGAMHLKKSDSPCSCQLPISPLLGMKICVPSLAILNFQFICAVRSWVDNHRYYEFMNAAAPVCPEDTISQKSSLTTGSCKLSPSSSTVAAYEPCRKVIGYRCHIQGQAVCFQHRDLLRALVVTTVHLLQKEAPLMRWGRCTNV